MKNFKKAVKFLSILSLIFCFLVIAFKIIFELSLLIIIIPISALLLLWSIDESDVKIHFEYDSDKKNDKDGVRVNI